MSFLGDMVSEDGISTDPAKLQKIMDCPAKDVHEVRSVLRFFSYYRRFIHHYSKSLVKLTEKERPFKWEKEQQKSFDDLKEMLSQAPNLVHPQPEGEFILDKMPAIKEMVQSYLRCKAAKSKMLSKTELNYTRTSI